MPERCDPLLGAPRTKHCGKLPSAREGDNKSARKWLVQPENWFLTLFSTVSGLGPSPDGFDKSANRTPPEKSEATTSLDGQVGIATRYPAFSTTSAPPPAVARAKRMSSVRR